MIKEKIDNFFSLFKNYEKNFPSYSYINYNFENIINFFERIGLNYNKLKYLHIAGTKGKGSTAYYLSSLLMNSTNQNIGLYTSPHIFKINERIKVNFRDITDEELISIIDKYYYYFVNSKLTYFDVLTIISVIYFIEKSCEYVVFETGLGGRLDSTNFCSPIISIITPISYDHTKILGKNLKSIAFEKAGIIKNNIPVIISKQPKVVLNVIKEKSEEKNAKLYELNKYLDKKILKRTLEGSYFNIIFQNNIFKNIHLKQLGDHFIDNFLLAILACKIIDIPISYDIINESAKINIPFRIKYYKNFVFDVSHNDASISALFKTLKYYFPIDYNFDLYISILFDKEIKRISKVIRKNISLFKNVFIFEFETSRKSGGKLLYDELKDIELAKYFENINDIKINNDSINVFTGSFYLIEKIVNILNLELYK